MKYKELKSFETTVLDVLDRAIVNGMTFLRNKVVTERLSSNPVHRRTGRLANSIIPVVVFSKKKYYLIAGMPYGKYLEFGTDAIQRKRGDRYYFAFLKPTWERYGKEFEQRITEYVRKHI